MIYAATVSKYIPNLLSKGKPCNRRISEPNAIYLQLHYTYNENGYETSESLSIKGL